ncbi:MAG: NADH-ubiquinone oxidoreductase-F iron-sulfur binding region domain-containing protein [Actinomycetota bacterium]|nr:NADH-ubiquinone oxidoreductase-F iron-sulfur binding region domain-containing protein [Actinomycetota bacterium]
MPKIESPRSLERYRKAIESERKRYAATVSVCGGTGCHAHECTAVYDAFEREIAARGLAESIELKMTGCHGFCEMGPLVVIWPQDIFYRQVKPEDVPAIMEKSVLGAELVEDLLYRLPGNGRRFVKEGDIPFYSRQMRVLMKDNGRINPRSIDDYIAQGGYAALAKALFEMEPEEIIDAVDQAGLRGRGGAGFPTARKWRACRAAKARDGIRYVLCNADEGDPGAYMDRSLLEGNPHAVLEGMTIGAYAIGANQGIIYVRHEYPLALENLFVALEQSRELGLLGVNILDSGFDFDIEVSVGGGAFICGESTALIASIEGHIGEPRVKHVHTAERGLYNRPTNLNNVETWANVPLIIKEGAEAYASVGTETSKGTKIFSLVGKINNTGLVEVPMGTTLREIIYDIGGGIPGGKAFKAVQTGGPSGGCIPESLLDTPVDFDRLYEAGSMMGSGGMIVMDEDTCMVDIARYFLAFLCDESCGKCVPCREGLKRMLHIIDDICEGRGSMEQLDVLRELAEVVRDTSLCGLGQTAPNPVLSTIRYFEDEYRAHIEEGRCPAGACKALVSYEIDPEACTGCLKCLKSCPVGAISGERKKPHSIDQSRCEKCGVCLEVCKYDAVTRK